MKILPRGCEGTPENTSPMEEDTGKAYGRSEQRPFQLDWPLRNIFDCGLGCGPGGLKFARGRAFQIRRFGGVRCRANFGRRGRRNERLCNSRLIRWTRERRLGGVSDPFPDSLPIIIAKIQQLDARDFAVFVDPNDSNVDLQRVGKSTERNRNVGDTIGSEL
jgi:hypothetical protein